MLTRWKKKEKQLNLASELGATAISRGLHPAPPSGRIGFHDSISKSFDRRRHRHNRTKSQRKRWTRHPRYHNTSLPPVLLSLSRSIYLSIYLSLFLFRLEVFHFFLSIDFWAFNDSPPTLCGSLLHQQFYGFPFYGISLSINGLNWVLPSFYGSYWLLLCFTGFCV